MFLGNFNLTADKYMTIYEDYGGHRKNGYISHIERANAHKRNKHKR